MNVPALFAVGGIITRVLRVPPADHGKCGVRGYL